MAEKMAEKLAECVDTDASKKWTKDNSMVTFMVVFPCVILGVWLVVPEIWPLALILAIPWLLGSLYLICSHPLTVKMKFFNFFAYFKKIVDVPDETEASVRQEDSSDTDSSGSQRVMSDGGEPRARGGTTPTSRAHVPRNSSILSSSSHRSFSSVLQCVSVTYLLVFLLGVSCLEQGGAGNGGGGAYLPSDQATPDIQGNVVDPAGDGECRRLNKTDYGDVEKDLLLGRIKYTADSMHNEMNLVEALAEENRWERVAEVRNLINPQTIHIHFKETREELEESSYRLFKELRNVGYKGEFGWAAYIEGFKNAENPRLGHVIKDLKAIVDCLGVSQTAMEAVTMQLFRTMKCGDKSLSLIEDVAEEWRSVAREFGVKEHLIFSERNIPVQCASAVLKQFYEFAFTWQEIVDIVHEAGLNKIAKKLERALDHYCAKD